MVLRTRIAELVCSTIELKVLHFMAMSGVGLLEFLDFRGRVTLKRITLSSEQSTDMLSVRKMVIDRATISYHFNRVKPRLW